MVDVSDQMMRQDRSVLFDPSARLYAAVFPKIWTHLTPNVQRWVLDRLRGRQRVLDAGTGSGHWLALAAGDRPRGRLVGIDLSSTFLTIAGERLAGTGAQLHRCDMSDTAFDDQEFDAIICAGVLDTVPDASAVLREFGRLLEPGGVVLLVLRPGESRLSRALEKTFRLVIGVSCAYRTRSLNSLCVPRDQWRRGSVAPRLDELCASAGLQIAETNSGVLTTAVLLHKPINR